MSFPAVSTTPKPLGKPAPPTPVGEELEALFLVNQEDNQDLDSALSLVSEASKLF